MQINFDESSQDHFIVINNTGFFFVARDLEEKVESAKAHRHRHAFVLNGNWVSEARESCYPPASILYNV